MMLYFALAYVVASLLSVVSGRIGYALSSAISLALAVYAVNAIHTMPVVAYFLLILAVIWFCTSVSYITSGRREAILFSLSIASMLIVLWARDVISFLIGWEAMTITSFLAMNRAKRASYAFLAFGELSTLLITLGFAAGVATTGSILISSFAYSPAFWLVFLLCSIGFAVKMEIFPFHIWAPPAYSSAPSNFSVLMSSSLTLMGVYGIVRLLSLSVPPEWIAILMLVFGAVTAVYGALHAATSEVVKELPAYSTIENDGVILVLLGAFVVASYYSRILAAFAITATLFYVFFHSTSKALMFLAIGEAEKENCNLRFGKVIVSPAVALAGYVASISLAAIPPMPGFTAEWMALETLFQSFDLHTPLKLLVVLTGALVALAAGISAISMSKMAVYVFRRGERKPGFTVTGALALSAVVVFAGILPPAIIRFMSPATLEISGVKATVFLGKLLAIPEGLLVVSGRGFGCISPTVLAAFVLALTAIVFVAFRFTIRGLRIDEPWNGGERSENYTPEGYSMIMRLTLKSFYRTREELCRVVWCDFMEVVYVRLSRIFSKLCDTFRVALMNGSVGIYVLYILVAMFAILIYAVR